MPDDEMMSLELRDETFRTLCKISDQNCDQHVKRRLTAMIGRSHTDIKDELLGLLDDAACYAWTSDFEMMVMDAVWRSIGGTEAELNSRNTEDTPENRAKYKWER